MNWKLEPQEVFAASPIIPVMVIEKLDDALPMAMALSDGGINVFEITLRTDCALDAIKRISTELPDAFVGAGTVVNSKQYAKAMAAGAQFVLSPGFSVELLQHAKTTKVPFIPGVATPSEIMTAMSYGYECLKFFPAEANGGVNTLKAITAPLPDVRFCPTGGINAGNAKSYLSLDCVATVGGTWMLDKTAIKEKNWSHITELTRQAVAVVSE
ncbi:bifunctional 4-hydroxy-2-oxoglutarate aldolase/2-dehydro-3-deoxy-phosphogluconate aldolase [Vibrio salinus]|uniref:bifunctional 4-hydroxy-2-oxoglutarate aldolase/2-dehydro-3-deoxy-phosphogluconate aldolase n=1 Tax=Vibrio salinus TaxID=2899784 RepID=UPI001E5C112D|nr:bifunctional 4-hydroxy-2-oxoglutarate aldolase/2-dehydro-3-deoxy-phosphogluconate aldolase [Vibrio salinus]MCE0493573.1 bifunctional 4-hydroxy-2-oxoglutarate aldolase/2-dehydro-3-deoxy-phosphogluconate aldolase [Vibrio salinus]